MKISNRLTKILERPTNEPSFKRAIKHLASHVEQETGLPLQRIYREIAYQAFLNRISKSGLRFILKGGFSLELQSETPTRVTTDIDMIYMTEVLEQNPNGRKIISEAIRKALLEHTGDFFKFKFEEDRGVIIGAPEGGERLSVMASLCGNNFERIMIDVSLNEEPVMPTQNLSRTGKHLQRISIDSERVEAISKEQHFAEKIHAYTRPRKSENSRAKDLVDLYILIENMGLDPTLAKDAVFKIFDAYRTHPNPTKLEHPPASWEKQWTRLTSEASMPALTMKEAFRVTAEFYEMILPKNRFEYVLHLET
jgi:predicted nucleotidyltransferase component of viral defense system